MFLKMATGRISNRYIYITNKILCEIGKCTAEKINENKFSQLKSCTYISNLKVAN